MVKTEKENTKVAPVTPTKEIVTVQLYKDAGKCSQPLTVRINGIRTVIPRGIPVQVSKDVKDVIDMKELQDGNTVDLITGWANDFNESTNEMLNK